MTHLGQGSIHELWRFPNRVRVVTVLAFGGHGAVVVAVTGAARGIVATRIHMFAPGNSSAVVNIGRIVGRILLLTGQLLSTAAIWAGR